MIARQPLEYETSCDTRVLWYVYTALNATVYFDLWSLTLQSAPISSDDIFANIAAAKTQRATVGDSAPLKTPPKWFRRPCGARFAVSSV